VADMNTLPIDKAAKYVGRSVKTLQRWDRQGTLMPVARTSTNRRVYSMEQLDRFLGVISGRQVPSRTIGYCRVSSQSQRSDLKNQRMVLEEFCAARGLHGVEFIEEIGGGMNFKRKRFLEIMEAVGSQSVKYLIVAHKDRLARFGFDWFDHYCECCGCEVMVLNQERLSPEEEMVQDLLSIVHTFSSRLYGLRNYRKQLKEALANDSKPQD